MKKYATWEMIKALSEDDKLKFKNIKYGYVASVSEGGNIVVNDGLELGGFNLIVHIYSEEHVPVEWELIQQPVSFMEAIQAYHEGKNIYSIVGASKCIYEPRHSSMSGGFIFMTSSSGEIVNGEWYIENIKGD